MVNEMSHRDTETNKKNVEIGSNFKINFLRASVSLW
jgi:hypothetical protein